MKGTKQVKRGLVSALLAAWLAAPVVRCAADESADAVFQSKVLPILQARCAGCHGPKQRKSGLMVLAREELLVGGSRYGPAVIPGHPEASVLVKRLRGELEPRMPLEGESLNDSEIETIAAWVRAMPPSDTTDRWWAVEAPRNPVAPEVQNRVWVRNPIDRFILDRLEESGIAPAPEASKRVLLRRLYFDLVGMPPTPEEAAAFLEDERADAYSQLVDRLLGDPRYGERWGQHWLDLVRYADSGGSEYDREYSHMWRYRDYVIDAFNDNKPYDEFVIEQIAGDEIEAPTIASRLALGFLRLTPEHGSPNKAKNRQLLLNELTATIGSVFLGTTLGCAQCHDHKSDPIPQKDFYRLQAFLVGILLDEADVPFAPDDVACMNAGRARAESELKDAEARFEQLKESYLERLRALLAAEGHSVDEAAERATEQQLQRRLEAAEQAGASNESSAAFSARDKQLYDRAYYDVWEGMGDGLYEPGAYRRNVLRYLPRAHIVRNPTQDYYARFPDLPAAFVRIRGEYDQLGEMVRPGFLSAVTGSDEPATPRTDKFGNIEKFRIGLAEWLGSAENPLTARVMVNRIWQHHFGEGIVRTPNNLGRNGVRPSHPELLDWLAIRFVESGWSIKGMHRLMLNSATYRQSSNERSPHAEQIDPQNHLLWRMRRHRLEGEAVRDSILAVSGSLKAARGGPAVYPPLPEGMEERIYYKRSRHWEPTEGAEGRRRSVYIFKRRQLEFPLMATLDAPVFHQSTPMRAVSTTPIQALMLTNGRLVNEAAVNFAKRVRREVASDDPVAVVRRAYLCALTRLPGEQELAAALEYLAAADDGDPLEGLCRVLLNLNEFVYVD